MRLSLPFPCALCFALSAVIAHAEPQYISDKLVVNVYAEADQESSKLDTLSSGDAVEAIEKVDTYTRVQLQDGREGWIKSSYLTAQEPAVLRLKELEKERASGEPAPAAPDPQLAQEIKQLKDHNAALQTEVMVLKQTAAKSAPTAHLAPEPTGVLQGPESPAADSTLALRYWAVPVIVLLAGALGYLLGYQALARRIRRKYGSVKIY